MVNSIKFIKGNKINPYNKYFGLSQTFNNDKEHTSSYSNTNVLASIVQTMDMQHQVTGLPTKE